MDRMVTTFGTTWSFLKNKAHKYPIGRVKRMSIHSSVSAFLYVALIRALYYLSIILYISCMFYMV